MSEESTEKQHQATAKRIENLRKQGQIMRSRDLTSGIIIIITVIMLFALSDLMTTRLLQNFVDVFAYIKLVPGDIDYPNHVLAKLATDNLSMLMPLLLVTLMAAFISPFVFGGWNFTLEAIQFKLTKLNPTNNLKTIFSKRVFVEVARSFIKLVVIFSVLVFFSLGKSHEIAVLPQMTFAVEIHHVFTMVKEYLGTLCASIVLIVVIDVIYHYFEFQNRVKMTTQEVKDETKETEGNADVKRRQRSSQFSLLRQRLHVTVPRSHVIITNPTHYAIALRYDEGKDRAPRVIAKGKDHLAQQIRKIAITNAVPIYEAPLLARAIYHTSELGAGIHPGLYMSVAMVLSYIHQLRNYQQGVGHAPQTIADLKIPNDLIYEE